MKKITSLIEKLASLFLQHPLLYLLILVSTFLLFPTRSRSTLEKKTWVRNVIVQGLGEPIVVRIFDPNNHVLISEKFVSAIKWDFVLKRMVDDSHMEYTVYPYVDLYSVETSGTNNSPYYGKYRELEKGQKIRRTEEFFAFFANGMKTRVDLADYLRLNIKRVYTLTTARLFVYKIDQEVPLPVPERLLFDY